MRQSLFVVQLPPHSYLCRCPGKASRHAMVHGFTWLPEALTEIAIAIEIAPRQK